MQTELLSPRVGLASAPKCPAGLVTEALEASLSSRWRRWVFRGMRLSAAGGLLWAAALLIQSHYTAVNSDQAHINGAISTLRAPIAGCLRLESWEPGMAIKAGATVFRVENPRFGNVEAMSQFNWVQDLVERLRVDYAEAELRYAKQEELFKHHEALFKENLMPRMEYIEEETKVALCRITMNNRKDQLRAAETRRAEMQQQVALQKEAAVTMPFDGVVWSVRGQNGNQVGAHESVLHVLDPKRMWVDAFLHERHAAKVQVGTQVIVRTLDGRESWPGRVESIRAGVGRLDPEQSVTVPAADLTRRRIAVRVKLDAPIPFTASEYFGVGRSVKVTLVTIKDA